MVYGIIWDIKCVFCMVWFSTFVLDLERDMLILRKDEQCEMWSAKQWNGSWNRGRIESRESEGLTWLPPLPHSHNFFVWNTTADGSAEFPILLPYPMRKLVSALGFLSATPCSFTLPRRSLSVPLSETSSYKTPTHSNLYFPTTNTRSSSTTVANLFLLLRIG